MMHRDAEPAEIAAWTRQLVDAIGAIPGFEIEGGIALNSPRPA
jgi:hypothetical protein